jgi:hypothetical protein
MSAIFKENNILLNNFVIVDVYVSLIQILLTFIETYYKLN